MSSNCDVSFKFMSLLVEGAALSFGVRQPIVPFNRSSLQQRTKLGVSNSNWSAAFRRPVSCTTSVLRGPMVLLIGTLSQPFPTSPTEMPMPTTVSRSEYLRDRCWLPRPKRQGKRLRGTLAADGSVQVLRGADANAGKYSKSVSTSLNCA